MTDLVERLHIYKVAAPPEHPVHPAICDEAADEIERLRAALELVVAVAEDYAMLEHGQQRSQAVFEMKRMVSKALEADDSMTPERAAEIFGDEK